MADASLPAFQASANLSLWFKVRGGDQLTLADIPEIIPLRWPYFRDNWEFIKPQIVANASKAQDPDFLNATLDTFSKFIAEQRVSTSNVNPFSGSIIYYRYYPIFDNVFIESIDLTNEEHDLVTNNSNAVSTYSKNDFLKIKEVIVAYRDRLADLGGLGDSTYDGVMNRGPITPQYDASITDVNLMLALQKNITSVDFVLANLFAVDAALNPFALARSNANNPDVNIGQYSSGRLVRINYGEDLESLATRYMGDPNKWIDIAIANGLKPPYLDEVGQRLFLISNANGNQINVGPTDMSGNINADKFFVNQVVVLQSAVENFPDMRTILDIKEVPVSGELVILLDGEADLDKYKLVDQANVRVFLPNTINSGLYILIPSEEPLDNPRQDEVPWFLAAAAADEKKAKIDIALNDDGDITFNTNGDLKLSYGLDNAVQAIKLKMMTELGTNRYHPDFGLVNIIGSKNQNLDDLKSLLIESISNQISIDSRFDRIESLNIQYLVNPSNNNSVAAMHITLSVRLAGGSTVIPITFTVAK